MCEDWSGGGRDVVQPGRAELARSDRAAARDGWRYTPIRGDCEGEIRYADTSR